MTDQANNLRTLIQNRQKGDEAEVKPGADLPPPAGAVKPSRVITVSSGKGGVGKSNFTVNLAISLIRRGKRCIIIDADFGLANVEVLMGVLPKFNLGDVLSGGKTINDILTDGPEGIKFISGGSGFSLLSSVTDEQITYMVENISKLDSLADIILIDTGAGISKQVIDFISASNETIIITTPEPTSITDAYAIIKSIKEQKKELPKFNIVVNRVDDKREGEEIFMKLFRVCDKFLGVRLNNLGCLPYDQYLVKAVKAQKPVGVLYPNSQIMRKIDDMGSFLAGAASKEVLEGNGLRSFMNKFVSVFTKK